MKTQVRIIIDVADDLKPIYKLILIEGLLFLRHKNGGGQFEGAREEREKIKTELKRGKS